MLFKQFDFSPGIITFNNYDISDNDEINDENFNLTEDMIQVKFKRNLTLDVGWYSGIKAFITFVIEDCDWENPLLRLESKSYENLKDSLDEAMILIKTKLDL